MIEAGMVARGARFLAPVALVAVGTATYAIVHSGLAAHHGTVARSTPAPASNRGRHHRHRTPKFYIVKSGDTLSGISARTHIPEFRLQALNPRMNPNSLQTGQRLRLRR
jgi:LysM repeat protein